MALFGESGMSIANKEQEPKTKIIKCPICEEPVEYKKDMDFYQCPCCGCEIWPKQVSYFGLREVYRAEVNRYHEPGSSNRSGGRKKAKNNVPLYTERYALF